MEPRLLGSEKSHIYYLRSKMKIKSKEPFKERKKDLFGFLEKLDNIPEISTILKVVQYIDNLDLVLDLENEHIQGVCPFASKDDKGLTLPFQKSIFVGANRPENQILGTTAHELTHMAIQVIFENDCNPYLKSDEDKQKKFQTLALKIYRATARLKGTPSEILIKAFEYRRREVHSELIARVSHILAERPDGRQWLENKVPDLLNFYENNVIAKCEQFIKKSFLLKPKSLIKKMNEDEGEINNLKKYDLFFDHIEEIKSFCYMANKKIFAFITNYTNIGLSRVLQSIYGVDYVERLFDHDCFLVFKLENCINNWDYVQYLFDLEAAEILLIEWPDGKVENLHNLIPLINTAKLNENKKIIFVMKEEENVRLKEILVVTESTDIFDQKIDEDFSVLDLTEDSRGKILNKSVLFQEEEIRLGLLINNNEDLLRCINAEFIQDMLVNKKIEIGNSPVKTSDLEGAYGDVVQEVNLVTLFYEMEFSDDVFIIFQMKDINLKKELEKSLKKKFDIPILHRFNYEEVYSLKGERVFVIDDKITEDYCKKICRQNEKKKIYFLEKEKGRFEFILFKIYNPDFYLKRQLYKKEKVVVKKEILSESHLNTTDTFLIVGEFDGTLKNKSSSKNVKFLNLREIEREFKKCSQPDEAVHILKIENNQLIWDKSSGNLTGLRSWIDESLSIEHKISENELINEIKNESIVILADDSGMGKSTTLTKLCDIGDKFRSLITTHWVMRINLKSHLGSIQNMQSPLNYLDVTNILMEANGIPKNGFRKKLLESALEKNKNFCKPLLIAFDGFDELIDKKDRNTIICLLKFLKNKTNSKLCVTTRLHFREILENELCTFAIKFAPIDDKSKKEFIKKYLKPRLKLLLTNETFNKNCEDNDETEEGCVLWKLATSFIEKAKLIFKENGRSIGTPLQLHLLLEDSFQSFRSWIQDPNGDPDLSYLGNNLLEVYEGFCDRKYEIYFKKINIYEEELRFLMKDSFWNIYEELAKSLTKNKKLSNYVINYKSLLSLLGITKLEGGNIEFIHDTFREYFFARSLIKNLIDQPDKTSLQFYMPEILLKKEYQMIRNFINDELGKPTTRKLLKCYEKEFLNFLSIEPHSKLLTAIEENNDNIFNFLINLNYSSGQVLMSKKSHIYILMSKIEIEPQHSFERREKYLFCLLEKLDEIPEISIILKILQYAENFHLIADFENNCEKKNFSLAYKQNKRQTLPLQKTVVIYVDGPEHKVLGITAHKLTHLAMEIIFKNDYKPYLKLDKNNRNYFQSLAEKINLNTPKTEGSPFEILVKPFCSYLKQEMHSELIATIPQILAEYPEGEEWLELNSPKLLEFYRQKVIPECEKFVESHFLKRQKSFIRSWRVEEGEMNNLKRDYLFFDNIKAVNNYLNKAEKNIFALITKSTKPALTRVLQGIYGEDYIKHHQRYFVLNLEERIKILQDLECLKAAELSVIKCPDIADGITETLIRTIGGLIEIVRVKKNKRIIFIMKGMKNELFRKILSTIKLSEKEIFFFSFFTNGLEQIDKEISAIELL